MSIRRCMLSRYSSRPKDLNTLSPRAPAPARPPIRPRRPRHCGHAFGPLPLCRPAARRDCHPGQGGRLPRDGHVSSGSMHACTTTHPPAPIRPVELRRQRTLAPPDMHRPLKPLPNRPPRQPPPSPPPPPTSLLLMSLPLQLHRGVRERQHFRGPAGGRAAHLRHHSGQRARVLLGCARHARCALQPAWLPAAQTGCLLSHMRAIPEFGCSMIACKSPLRRHRHHTYYCHHRKNCPGPFACPPCLQAHTVPA